MRTRARIVLLAWLAAVGGLAGLAAQAQQPTADDLASPKLRVSWDAFKKLYDSNAAVVIDVRDAASFEAGHIPGARNVPLDQVEAQTPALRKLTKPIVVYCA